MEVSAKTGKGVKEAFGRLITEVYYNLQESMRETDPDLPNCITSSRMASFNQEDVFRNSLSLGY